jgi:SAM-dependent methyltransferase
MTTPSSAAVRAEYQDAARLDARIALHRYYSANPQSFYAWVFTQLQVPAGGRVLDIGCGSGRMWVENQARVPDDWTVMLADLSPGMVQTAATGLRPGSGQFRFAASDVQTLPFADQCFDTVIATHMLYHVPDRLRAYAEIRRVLRPGGRFYASANSRTTMQRYDQLLALARDESPAGISINDSAADVGFNLEQGGADLGRAFAQVGLHRYADALILDAADPLVAYAAASGHLTGAALDRFRDLVTAAVAAEGTLRIDKRAGLFEAALAP